MKNIQYRQRNSRRCEVGLADQLRVPVDVHITQDNAETLLLNARTGTLYALDEVSTRIWKLFEGNNKISEIATTIGEQYNIDLDVVQRDVIEFATDLLQKGMLQQG